MAEYIDREDAKKIIKKHMTKTANNFKNKDHNTQSIIRELYLIAIDHAIEFLSIIPDADVTEVKHGEWIYSAETIDTKAGYVCSACKDVIWHAPDVPQAFRRCPTCGAKMDGKEKE